MFQSATSVAGAAGWNQVLGSVIPLVATKVINGQVALAVVILLAPFNGTPTPVAWVQSGTDDVVEDHAMLGDLAANVGQWVFGSDDDSIR